jgi:hypothetical protein
MTARQIDDQMDRRAEKNCVAELDEQHVSMQKLMMMNCMQQKIIFLN